MVADGILLNKTFIDLKNTRLCLQGNLDGWQTELRKQSQDNDVEIVEIKISSGWEHIPPRITLSWEVPVIDVLGCWTPNGFNDKGIYPDWGHSFPASMAMGAPAFCLFGGNSRNRLTCSVSDVLNHLEIKKGVNEESGYFHCSIDFFKEAHAPLKEYLATVRLDWRDIHFSQSLADTAGWWNKSRPAMKIPDEAWLPVYSTWYAFHQDLNSADVEKQCRKASELGCGSVIIDDGWQTSDNNRGYAYCGDWELCKERFADMSGHVKAIQNLGMKYMLWYSVAFVGIHSRAYTRFKKKLLYFNEGLKAGVLDPRFKEARDYLVDIYASALKKWHLDGVKLDFIDSFSLPEGTTDPASENAAGRDILSIPEAVSVLMQDIRQQLTRIKPDILIEFRQNYTGPAMQQYGNMLRAADCPNDAVANRIRTADIRMSAPNSCTHSDMLMWNYDEPVETAARQLLNVIFAVPQISVRLDRIPQGHFDMLNFYLKYQQLHSDVFLRGDFSPMAPELNYPWIMAKSEDKQAIAVYSENIIIPLNLADTKLSSIINASSTPFISLEIQNAPANMYCRIFDARGNKVNESPLRQKSGLLKIPVPVSGLLELYKLPAADS